MVFEWKSGYRGKADANVAGSVIKELDDAGNLNAKALVDVSRPEDAPLHNEFEWDDSIAAEKYREEQARYLIRHITIVTEDSEPVRAFFKIAVKDSEPENYTSVIKIMSDAEARAALLKQAFNEMYAFRKKYSMLTELAKVFAAIDEAQLTIE